MYDSLFPSVKYTMLLYILMVSLLSYLRAPVTGVGSRLNSATGTPLAASRGAYPAAGYTTEDVPTCVCV